MRSRRRKISITVARPSNTPAILRHAIPSRWLRASVATNAKRERRRPASALPSGRIPSVNQSGPGEQDQDHFSDDEPPVFHQPLLPRRHQRRLTAKEENKRLHERWDACSGDNVFRNTCYQACRQARQAALQHQLKSEFSSAALAALPPCNACTAAGALQTEWEMKEAAPRIVYVSINGRTDVPAPDYRCSGCGSSCTVDPVSMGCFPGTPERPLVYYSEALMRLTHQITLASPTSMVAWTGALEEIHNGNGCVSAEQRTRLPQKIWRNLSVAVRQWRRMDAATHDINKLGVPPLSVDAVRSFNAGDLPQASSQAVSGEAGVEITVDRPSGILSPREASASPGVLSMTILDF